MNTLRIYVLKGFQVSLGEKNLDGFESDKVRALLVYLAIEQGQAHRREVLAELLWPDRPEQVGRNNLKQALANLRSVIGDRDADPPYLTTTRHEIHFNSASNYWMDAAEFQSLFNQCTTHHHRRLNSCSSCIRRLRTALDLYQTTFLDQFFVGDSVEYEEWILVKREAFRKQALLGLQALTEHDRRRGDYPQAIRFVQRQLDIEPWDEQAHHALMELYTLQGDRIAAIKQYQTASEIMTNELGVELSQRIQQLYDSICDTDDIDTISVDNATKDLHNLRPYVESLIGRKQDITRIEDQLDHPGCRLLTLVGPGGVGKTRLAQCIAQDNLGNYEHGVYLISLDDIESPEQVLPAIANTIGYTISSSSDLLDEMVEFLSTREMLIILDNFEHLLTVRHNIQEILKRLDGIKLLVTSRERLNISLEYVYRVSGLHVPDSLDVDDVNGHNAISLFIARAKKIKPSFDLQPSQYREIVRICQYVEGMPLSLELAASWVSVLSVEQIRGDIERDLSRLTSAHHHTDDRHRSIIAVFEQSWQMLEEREQSILMGLSVFVGGFDLAGAQAVTGATPTELHNLEAKSLIRTDETIMRFSQHQLLRQYAKNHLEQSDDQFTFRQRHSCYYGQWLASLIPDMKGRRQIGALNDMKLDFGNIRRAWEWAVYHEDLEVIGQCTHALGLYAALTSRRHEIEALLRAGRERLSSHQSEIWWRLIVEHELTLVRTDPESVNSDLVHQAIAQAYEREDIDAAAYALRVLSYIHVLNDNMEKTIETLQESTRLYRLLEDDYSIANNVYNTGVCYANLGQIEQLSVYSKKALDIARQAGDINTIIYALEGSASVATHSANYALAQQYTEEAYKLGVEYGDNGLMASSLTSLAEYAISQGDISKARHLLIQTEPLFMDVSAPYHEGEFLYIKGIVAGLDGNYVQAIEYLDRAMTLTGMQPLFRMMINWAYALVACGTSNWQPALTYIANSLTAAEQLDQPTVIDSCIPLVALVTAANGDLEHALQLVAFAETHVAALNAWIRHFGPFQDLITLLENEFSDEVYSRLWKQGSNLILQDIISPFAEIPDTTGK